VSLYGALGVGNALQYAMNTIWAIPRNSRPNPLLARARSLLLVVIAGVAVSATTVISAFASATTGWGVWQKVLVALASIIINTGIVLLCFRIGVGSVRRRHLLPGAVLAAIGWQALQTFGVVYVGRVVKNASATNGVVSFILGLLAFIYLAAVIIVMSAEMSVVRASKLYPRALLTPFTDAVSLTAADKVTYANQARAMRTKGYERIDVTFEDRRKADNPDQ
jgi:membrane protein